MSRRQTGGVRIFEPQSSQLDQTTYFRQDIEKNLELCKAGKPNKSMIMSYSDFVADFKVLVKYQFSLRNSDRFL